MIEIPKADLQGRREVLRSIENQEAILNPNGVRVIVALLFDGHVALVPGPTAASTTVGVVLTQEGVEWMQKNGG